MSDTCRVSFQNKFEKLVQLVGFIIRIFHDVWSHELKKKSFRVVERREVSDVIIMFIVPNLKNISVILKFQVLTLTKLALFPLLPPAC
jgi:hypothetical protein